MSSFIQTAGPISVSHCRTTAWVTPTRPPSKRWYGMSDGQPVRLRRDSAGWIAATAQPAGWVLSFEFCGNDSNRTIVPPAPPFASAWRAGEMVEVYWASLLRDVQLRDEPLCEHLARSVDRTGLRRPVGAERFPRSQGERRKSHRTRFSAARTRGARSDPTSRSSCSRTSVSEPRATRRRCACTQPGTTT